jgi:hypothetical protein
MTLDDFVNKIEAIINDADHYDVKHDREKLRIIWEQVRNGAAFDLAKMQQQRDDAIKQLHKRYLRDSFPK